MKNIIKQLVWPILVFSGLSLGAQDFTIKAEVKKTKTTTETSSDGSLEITKIEGGQPPYEIHWFGFNVRDERSHKIENLKTGRYVLLVQDKDRNSLKLEFTIDCCR